MLKRIIVFVIVFFVAQVLMASLFGIAGGIGTLMSLGLAGFAAWKAGGGTATATPTKQDESKPALSELPELQGVEPICGIWEDVYWDNKNFNGIYKCSGDELEAVAVFVTHGALYRFSEAKETGQEAKEGKVSGNTRLAAKIPLTDIQSVEMESASQFHGVAVREQYVPPKMSGYKQLKERHPSLNWDGYGFHDSNTRQAIVYLFTKDGDRIRLFQTWSRDMAIKWRTQVANRIEAALHSKPAAVKPEDGKSDYL